MVPQMKMSQATFFRQLKKYLDSKENGTEYKPHKWATDRVLSLRSCSAILSRICCKRKRVYRSQFTSLLLGLSGSSLWLTLRWSQTQRDFYVKNAGGEQFCYTVLNPHAETRARYLLGRRENVTELSRRVQLQPERTAAFFFFFATCAPRACSLQNAPVGAQLDRTSFAAKVGCRTMGL
jgi:hypothetical protein